MKGDNYDIALETFPSAVDHERDAASVINGELHETGHVSMDVLARNIEAQTQQLHAAEKLKAEQYIAMLRDHSRSMMVDTLDPNVGGYFDGSIVIATSTLEIGGNDVEETIARAEEVKAHEQYHNDGKHLDGMITGSADGDSVVTIGGTQFSNTALIEGLTVAMTGEEFVSQTYKKYAAQLRSAVAMAGIGLDDVAYAVNVKKDVRSIDDNRDGVASYV